jgi:NAD(P)-dependent dehydrogenase (short-subunit alcohol dehydrogenase family)
MDVRGSNCLIAGGASGLGEACARRFVAAGASVVIADRNAAAGDALASQLGASARFVAVDVTSESDVHRAVQLARAEFGGVDVAINCAGILGAARIVGRDGPHDLALFERVVRVNLIGTFNVLRLAAAAMAENLPGADGERGVIINTSSIAAWEGQTGQAAYSASKGGVAALTLPAARELARRGIRVAAITPGVFETPMMGGEPDEIQASLAAQIPFPPRFGKPEEFAALAQHIVENRMLNGCVLRLDGALRMGAK